MVEAHHQRLETELAHNVPELENAVLSARIGHDAVVEALVAVLANQLLELLVALVPVDLGITDLDLAANAAGTGVVKRCRLRRFRQ